MSLETAHIVLTLLSHGILQGICFPEYLFGLCLLHQKQHVCNQSTCNNQSQAETEKSLQVSQMMGQTKDQEQQREPAQNWRNRKGGGVSGTQKPDHLAGARTLCRVSQRELEAQRPLSSKGWHLQEPSHLWKCHTWWGWGMLQPPLSLATPLQGLDVQENKRVKKIEPPNTESGERKAMNLGANEQLISSSTSLLKNSAQREILYFFKISVYLIFHKEKLVHVGSNKK